MMPGVRKTRKPEKRHSGAQPKPNAPERKRTPQKLKALEEIFAEASTITEKAKALDQLGGRVRAFAWILSNEALPYTLKSIAVQNLLEGVGQIEKIAKRMHKVAKGLDPTTLSPSVWPDVDGED